MTAYSGILQETIRFRKALPELLNQYRGRWVVFEGGRVQSVHSSEDEACRAAMSRYGPDGAFVVDRVEPKRAIPLTAAVVYG